MTSFSTPWDTFYGIAAEIAIPASFCTVIVKNGMWLNLSHMSHTYRIEPHVAHFLSHKMNSWDTTTERHVAQFEPHEPHILNWATCGSLFEPQDEFSGHDYRTACGSIWATWATCGSLFEPQDEFSGHDYTFIHSTLSYSLHCTLRHHYRHHYRHHQRDHRHHYRHHYRHHRLLFV